MTAQAPISEAIQFSAEAEADAENTGERGAAFDFRVMTRILHADKSVHDVLSSDLTRHWIALGKAIKDGRLSAVELKQLAKMAKELRRLSELASAK